MTKLIINKNRAFLGKLCVILWEIIIYMMSYGFQFFVFLQIALISYHR